jgi:hypothetical protein
VLSWHESDGMALCGQQLVLMASGISGRTQCRRAKMGYYFSLGCHAGPI